MLSNSRILNTKQWAPLWVPSAVCSRQKWSKKRCFPSPFACFVGGLYICVWPRWFSHVFVAIALCLANEGGFIIYGCTHVWYWWEMATGEYRWVLGGTRWALMTWCQWRVGSLLLVASREGGRAVHWKKQIDPQGAHFWDQSRSPSAECMNIFLPNFFLLILV